MRHFQVRYVDDPDTWLFILPESVKARFSRHFRDVPKAVKTMTDEPGREIRTPNAFYRVIEDGKGANAGQ